MMMQGFGISEETNIHFQHRCPWNDAPADYCSATWWWEALHWQPRQRWQTGASPPQPELTLLSYAWPCCRLHCLLHPSPLLHSAWCHHYQWRQQSLKRTYATQVTKLFTSTFRVLMSPYMLTQNDLSSQQSSRTACTLNLNCT